MPLLSSSPLTLGTPMPSFTVDDVVKNQRLCSDDLPEAKATVIAFLCNHCPYVIHIRDPFTRFGNDNVARGVNVLAISSNSVKSHPMDGPLHMEHLAQELGWDFPYGFDETQEVAQSFKACCTPEFFVFNQDRKLAYHGQFDSSRPGDGQPVTGRDLQAAVDALLRGGQVSAVQAPSVGCSIKWNEPLEEA